MLLQQGSVASDQSSRAWCRCRNECRPAWPCTRGSKRAGSKHPTLQSVHICHCRKIATCAQGFRVPGTGKGIHQISEHLQPRFRPRGAGRVCPGPFTTVRSPFSLVNNARDFFLTVSRVRCHCNLHERRTNNLTCMFRRTH